MIRARNPLIITVALLAAAAGIVYLAGRGVAPDLAPFFPTPNVVVRKMLEMAKVGPEDLVYDLGSGDGRIVIRAAELFGASGVGVEYDPPVAQLAIDIVKNRGLEDKVQIIVGDALKVDVSPATVVTIYLLPDTISLLRPILERSLKPGTRVVSHNSEMPGWDAVRTEMMDDGTGRIHTLWLYEMGKE